ncbi:MAG: hypothetical protein GDA56_14495 [Hormoscilla sp. GM7CHS1pb]|nr:hypothetical protein [Hormoscilla sp. GM7CHS1pb]
MRSLERYGIDVSRVFAVRPGDIEVPRKKRLQVSGDGKITLGMLNVRVYSARIKGDRAHGV